MQLEKNKLYPWLAFVYVYISSYYLSILYINGDQFFYHHVYNEIKELGLLESFNVYSNSLNSRELGHFLIIKFFSLLSVDKNFVMSGINAFIAYLITKILVKNKCHLLIIILFITTNFYLWVLFLSAERLKVSFLFYILSFVSFGYVRFYGFMLLAISSHAQMLLMYIAQYMKLLYQEMFNAIYTGKVKVAFFAFILLVALFVIPIWGQLEIKVVSYASKYSISLIDLFKVLTLSGLAIMYSNKRLETLFVMLPLIASTLIFGSSRILIFIYFIFFYIASKVNNGFNAGIIGTSMYFSYQYFEFIISIIETGDGFK
ncbi:hypothetical protein KW456_14885 [Vibrio fluvialis]|nr:hypothetical protein [Vibrio fluvialis]